MIACFALLFFSVFSQTTYYVASNGSDSSSCGSSSAPCLTINQVLTNYPGATYTVSIGAGAYTLSPFNLTNDAVVTFQGTSNPLPTIAAEWKSGSLINNSQASGVHFFNLSITLSGAGDGFITLNAAGNHIGIHNSQIAYSGDQSYAFINSYGGSVEVTNVTLASQTFDSYFIVDMSDGEDSNITIDGSTFANLTIGEDGGLLVFDAYGAANIVLNGSTFNGINADYAFIGFWAEDSNQAINITNNQFSNINTYLPSVYIENDYQCVVYVSNDTWTNSTADFVCGSLETLGSDDGNDHNITLDNLVINGSTGAYAGAILVGFNSLNVSNSRFANNRGGYGADLVQGLDSYTSQLGYNITNSCSDSDPPKAVIWNLSTGSVTDISDQLPACKGQLGGLDANPHTVRPLTRKDVSASPKFGRKPRKN